MGAFGNFLVLVIIGAGLGFAMTRGRSVRLAGTASVADATPALVGVAGSFMGYHIGLILGLYNDFVLYVVAAGIAALTMLAWRSR
jgi:hypothetical protein